MTRLDESQPRVISGPWAPGRSTIHVSGVQACIRFIVEVLRADAHRGVHTAAFVSGYQGSPLAGFDQELRAAKTDLDVEIVHQPGVNEELGATAVMGSQLTATQPSSRYDGVLGIWYGKAPGLDRSMDALRHANYAGASPHGGAIALVGDDPNAKSSTLPSASEVVLADLAMPVLFPRSLADIIELGQHAVAMSRYSGSWVAIKMVTSVADSEGTVDTGSPIEPVTPDDYVAPIVSGDLLTPTTLQREAEVLTNRLAAAIRYGEANELNRLFSQPTRPRLAIAAAGSVFSELVEALHRLNLDTDAMERLGIRLGEVRMPFPIGAEFAGQLASDVDDLIVVEERRELVEHQLLSLLARRGNGPRIWGRTDPNGQPFIRGDGSLDAAELTEALYPLLASLFGDEVAAPPPLRTSIPVSLGSRVPWYCSGCPHSVSTVVPPGALVGAGIGCHSIVRFMPEERVGKSIGNTQMGGEGAQWIGMAPFINESHIFQNLGDGTFFHSGHLAVRAAISAQVSMTFKILWNDVSAMTGGQHVEGSIPPLDVARMLLLEGVKQVVITTEDPSRYRGRRLPKGVSVRSREDVVAVQTELALLGGVTIMIHDQACATELRRARKRGRAPLPTFRVVINERVCEGCGDCQTKSNCLSLQTIDTDFGPKTRIDEGTCNVDLSCLAGDCPAFTLVKVDARDHSVRTSKPEAKVLAEPPAAPSTESLTKALTIRVAGIGGTGVVTAAHLLARAAMLDGFDVWGLDQTGLSQKAGPVVSDLRIGPRAKDRSNILGDGEIDLLIAADLMAATQPSSIAGASTDRTTVVGSSTSTLSGPMILGAHDRQVPINELASLLASVVQPDHSTFVDAEALAVKSSGTTSTSNVVLLGVAYQLGVLPLTWSSLVEAITQFGVAVEANLAALEAGREWVNTAASTSVDLESDHSRTVDSAFAHAALPDAYRDHITALAVDLRDYQSLRLSNRYLSLVELAWTSESQLGGDGSLANAVADGYFKLLAYKDEYEVARLLLSEPKSSTRTTWLLHPPLLRSLGLKHKVHLGPWARPIMKSLRAGRRLRETPLDPFGRTRLRTTERELHREYAALITSLVPQLTHDNVDDVEAIARLPLQIRGYEDVKMQSIIRYRASLAARFGRAVTRPSQDAASG